MVIFLHRKPWIFAYFVFAVLLFSNVVIADEIDDLRNELREMRKRNAEIEKRLDQIESQPAKATPSNVTPAPASAIDQAVSEINAAPPENKGGGSADLWSKPLGSTANLRLIDISMDVLFNVGGSTESDVGLQTLQGGDHDPKKRGFTLGQAELSLAGAVDPYITGEAHIVYQIDALSGDSQTELEEAFLTTTSLPFGLQIKAGQFLTEFGIINPTHPHAWLWMDQPIINSRLFGADGLRTPGARLAWLAPVNWYSEFILGLQNANGETATSFLGDPDISIGGSPYYYRGFDGFSDFLYTARWANAFNLTPTITAQVGISGLMGPNSSGSNGETWIYGGDVVVKWKPVDNFRGWPFVIFQGEAMERIYRRDYSQIINDPTTLTDDVFVTNEYLKDYGFYAQLLYGFYPRWAAGVRYEFVNGNSPPGTNQPTDPYRAQRQRVSPMVTFNLSEFSRLRLQYNYDNSDQIYSGSANSVWAGIEFMFGSHPAHKF